MRMWRGVVEVLISRAGDCVYGNISVEYLETLVNYASNRVAWYMPYIGPFRCIQTLVLYDSALDVPEPWRFLPWADAHYKSREVTLSRAHTRRGETWGNGEWPNRTQQHTTRCGHFDQICFLWLAIFGQKIEIDFIAQLKIIKRQ